jgi:hypothetical protein
MPSHPAKIGKYDIEGIIGRGGMGLVYKGVDSQLGRYVAIKMILSEDDPALLERFRSEARLAGSLQCPNIVTVYDFGEQDGNPYLVMQYVEGASLESLIHKGTQLTLAERLGIIVDVCNGLAYAHQRGIIHRDIKPANIMVLQDGVNDGTGVIVDFGIARLGGATRFTRTDQIVGSVHYMSPEQLQAKELDGRSDIYSTGIVLFQLLTGVLPFDAPEMAATFQKIINDVPPPLSAYLKEYPVELEGMVNRALAKNREDRYPTAQDFAVDLAQVQERLKSETVAQIVRRAEAALTREEWTRAREHLNQVLRIDRQNTQAQRMMSAVQERLRLQQQIEQARILCTQANEAYLDQRHDDALRLLDQAAKLDPQNNDLQSLRTAICLSKERAMILRRALRRAEAALQDGDLDEANDAIDEASEIDPQDTQVSALRLIVSRESREKARQEQLKKLLDEAREQYSGRDLTGAFATLKAAEALDPTSSDVRDLIRLWQAAQEQEKRRTEIQKLHKQIEMALQREDYDSAVAKAGEGLRKFPQEPSLLKIEALAEAEQRRVQQKKFASDQLSAAKLLAGAGEVPQAIAQLNQAIQRLPRNTELESLRAKLIDRLATEEAEKEKLRAFALTLEEARRVLSERGAKSSAEYLDTYSTEYGEREEFRQLYDRVREQLELDALDACLAIEPNPQRRIEIADKALRNHPTNSWIGQRLAALNEEHTRISTGIEHARTLEASNRIVEAIQKWRELAGDYPQLTDFVLQANRLELLLASQQQATNVPRPAEVIPDSSQPKPLLANLSATVVFDKASTDARMPVFEAPTASSVPATEPNDSVLPAKVPPQTPRTESSDRRTTYLMVGVAAVIVAVGIYLIRGRTTPVAMIDIATSPADADITIGTQKCRAPCTLKLPPGNYELRADRDGYIPLTQNVSIAPGMKSLPLIELHVPPPPPLPSPPPALKVGSLRVSADVEGAEVYVDNNLKGLITAGQFETKIDAGSHVVMLKKSGYEDSLPQRVEVASAELSARRFALKKLTNPVKEEEPAYLEVNSMPGASVVIDQSFGSTVPANGKLLQKVTPGSHSVAVTKDGFEQWSGTSTAQAGKQIVVMAGLREKLPLTPVPPVINFFNPSVSTVEAGKSVVLNWQTQHADEVRIEPGIGSVDKSGTTQVAPASDTTYTLTARASGLSTTRSVMIAVNLPPPPPLPHTPDELSLQDKNDIQALLVRYADAVARKDAKEIEKMWPGVPKEKMKAFKAAFELNTRLSFSDWHFFKEDNQRVRISCTQQVQAQLDGKTSSSNKPFTLYVRKKDNAWQIDYIPQND